MRLRLYLAVFPKNVIPFTLIMAFESDKKYHQPVFKLYQPDDTYKKQPLPKPSGAYPYHLDAEKFAELPHDGFSFTMVGDTGGIRYPDGQKKIAQQMYNLTQDEDEAQRPKFLYHLGDVVYHYGEAEQYDRQFFKPYEKFDRPVFAIAGNHDSDINPDNPVPYNSLDAFMAVFCDTESRDIPFSEAKKRKSMVQPNVYWTLHTPLATIIGLHSNVPKYGFVDNEQRKWFVEELKAAAKERPGKLILVCIHHAPYTADTNHGASEPMIKLLEGAFEESGVLPDAVFSGHVHNYQRFNKTYPNGKVVPFIVCGAGGFDELHPLVTVGDPMFTPNSPLFDNIALQSYCDARHGFLKISLEKQGDGVVLNGEYFAVSKDGELSVACEDTFSY